MENLENQFTGTQEPQAPVQDFGASVQQQSPVPVDPAQTDPNYEITRDFITASNFFGDRLSQMPSFRNPGRYSQLEVRDISNRYLNSDFGFNPEIDNEDFLAQRQGVFETLAQIPLKLPAYIVTKVGSGAGFIAGLANPVNWYEAARGQENLISLAADNSIAKFFDESEQYLRDEFLPVYQDAEDRDKGFFARAFTDANFWAEDVVDGAAFMASAWIPGLALSKLKVGTSILKGLSKVGLATEAATSVGAAVNDIGKGVKYVDNAAKYATRIDKFNQWALATASEAMFEAKGVKDKVYESLEGQGLSEEERKKRAGDAAFNTFIMNAGLLGVTNVFEMPLVNKILNKTEGIAKNIVGGAALGEDVALREAVEGGNKFLNNKYFNFAKPILPSVLREGYLEENGQLAIQRISERMGAQGKVSSILDWNTWYNSDPENRGVLNQFATQTKETLPFLNPNTSESRETAMNIGLGGLLGGGQSAVADYKQGKKDKLTTEDAIKYYNLSQENWLKFGNIYQTQKVESTDANGNKVTTDKVVFGADGKPVIDQQKLAAIAMSSGINFQAVNSTEDDTNMSRRNYVRDLAFADFVRAHINAGMEEGLLSKLDKLSEAAPEDVAKLGFIPDDSAKDQIARYKNLANTIIEQNKLVNDDILFDGTEEDRARKHRLLELASTQAVLNNLITEEQDRISKYKNELSKDPNQSSLSDSLADQLNDLQHRILNHETYIKELKESGDEDLTKSRVKVAEELLEDLQNQKASLLKDNEETAKNLKTDSKGFYRYEKNEKNQSPFFKSFNRLTAYKGILQNNARLLGREWGEYADFDKGKQNFLDKFINEQLVGQINSEEEKPQVPPASGTNTPPPSPGGNTSAPTATQTGPQPPATSTTAPTQTLEDYLKFWYDKYKAATEGAIDRGEQKGAPLSFEEWKKSPIGESKVREYNRKKGQTGSTQATSGGNNNPPANTGTQNQPAPVSGSTKSVIQRFKNKNGQETVVVINLEKTSEGRVKASFNATTNSVPVNKKLNGFYFGTVSGLSVKKFYEDYGVSLPVNIDQIKNIIVSEELYDPKEDKTFVNGIEITEDKDGKIVIYEISDLKVKNRKFTLDQPAANTATQSGQQSGQSVDNNQQKPLETVTEKEFDDLVKKANFFLDNPKEPTVIGSIELKYPNLYNAIVNLEKERREDLKNNKYPAKKVGSNRDKYGRGQDIYEINGKQYFVDYKKGETLPEVYKIPSSVINAKYDEKLDHLRGQIQPNSIKNEKEIADRVENEMESKGKMVFDFSDEEIKIWKKYYGTQSSGSETDQNGDQRNTELPGPNDKKDYDDDPNSNRFSSWQDNTQANAKYLEDLRQIEPFNSLANATDLVEVVVNDINGQQQISYRRNGVNPNYEFTVATREFMPGAKIEFEVKTSGYENYPPNRLDNYVYEKDKIFDSKGNVVYDALDVVPINVYTVLNGKRKLIGTLHEPKWIGWTIGDKYPHIAAERDKEGDDIVEKEIKKNLALRKKIIEAYNNNHKAVISGVVTDKSVGVLRTTDNAGKISERVNPEIAKGGTNNPHGMFAIIKQGNIHLDKNTTVSADQLVDTKSFSPENIAKYEGIAVLLLPTPTGKFFPTFIQLPNLTNEQSTFILEAWKAFTKQTDNIELVDKVYNALGLTRNPSDPNFRYSVLSDYIHQYYTIVDKDRISRTGSKEGMTNGQARMNINNQGHLELSVMANDRWYDLTGKNAIKTASELPVDILSLMSNLKTSVSLPNTKLSSIVGINSTRKVPILTIENGKLVSRDKTYNQHIMDNALTYVEQGVESNNSSNDWVYFANPVVKMDITNISDEQPDSAKDIVVEESTKPPASINEESTDLGKQALSILDALNLNSAQIDDQKNNCNG